MVNFISSTWYKVSSLLAANKKTVLACLVIVLSAFAYFRPQQFVDLWLTRDQQGTILFSQGHYQQASTTFTDTKWQAYSNYGAEQFKNAATLYSQFSDVESQLAKANALAHGREYLAARNLYQEILNVEPQNVAAQTNIAIVQAIIDDINRLSASQKAEQGEAMKELGDEPRTADGADRQEARIPQKLKQLSAEQLLLDPNLNDMWLRQVQKNPANFLSQKFYMQEQLKTNQPTTNTSKSEQ